MDSVIYSMLQMIAPECGIVIDENIGLLGEFKDEASYDKNIKQLTIQGYSENEIRQVAVFHRAEIQQTRGDFFRVIGNDGCILFDERVESTILLYRENVHVGYMFILRDVKAYQVLDDFFDDEASCRAVIIYYNNNLYINNIQDDEIKGKYKYDKSIKIEEVDNRSFRIEFKNDIFYSYVVSYHNRISIANSRKLHV